MNLENWKAAVLQILDELSNPEFQEKVWLRHEGALVSSPSDASDELFNDTGLGEELKTGEVFSSKADSLLKDLRKNLAKINFDQTTEKLLASQEWLGIRDLAMRTLQEVQDVLNSK